MITKSEIRLNVTSKPNWAERAILALYAKQTSDEQAQDATHHLNAQGFNSCDAEILSSFARWIQSGHHLSEKQLAIAFKKLGKYAGQLERIAQGS